VVDKSIAAMTTSGFVAGDLVTVISPSGTSESLPVSCTNDSDHAECGGVTIVEFSERSLHRTLYTHSVSTRGAMAISKNEIHSAISAPIALKFCKRL